MSIVVSEVDGHALTMSQSSLCAGRDDSSSKHKSNCSENNRGQVTPNHTENSDSAGKRSGSGRVKGAVGESGRGTVETLNEASAGYAENGGKKDNVGKSTRKQESNSNSPPPRLLVVSSKIKNCAVINAAVLPNVTFVQYKYETATLDGVLGEDIFVRCKLHIVSFIYLKHVCTYCNNFVQLFQYTR